MAVSQFPHIKSYRLGPTTNEFTGVDEAAALASRDSYFSSNPSKLAVYDGNSFYLIRLTYGAIVRAQGRLSGSWFDYTPFLQGIPGEVASLVGVPVGEIPYKLPNGTFGGSGMRVLENNTILAPPGFGVESGSVTFGDVLKLSEVAGFLGISNLLNDRQYTIVDFYTPRTALSSEPTVFHLIESEFEFFSQPVDTTNLPDNPLVFNYTVQNNARTNSIKFRTYAPMTNVRIKISQISNGVALKYLPNKTAWEKEVDGLTWGLGDNSFDFLDSPVILSAGVQLKFEIKADVVALKGNATGIAYFTATLQRGVFDDVITSRVYTATDIKAKLETLSNPNKLAKTAIQDAVLTVNGDVGDVVVSTTSIGAQPVDATLTALASQTTAANGLTYSTGVDTFSQTVLTPYARTILDDTSDAQVRATLNLGDVATRNVDVANGIATLDGSGKLTQMPNKTDVGLANIDNTSDINKPVSTAQQTAIDLKMSQHLAAGDPHPQYTTPSEASAAAPVQSVNAKVGAVTLVTGDIPEATNLYYTDVRVGSYLTTSGYTVKTVASSGGGSSVFNANTAGAVTLRSIIATGGVTATQNANDITINAPILTTGNYTPTLFNTTNVAASVAHVTNWMRVGNMVTVSGRAEVDPTNNNQSTVLGISLPITSNLASSEDVGGSAAAADVAGQCAAILGDATNDRALMQYVSGSAANHSMWFTFMYEIL